MEYSEEDYIKTIPECCSLQTMEEHNQIMLCWEICQSIRSGGTLDCDGCFFKLEIK